MKYNTIILSILLSSCFSCNRGNQEKKNGEVEFKDGIAKINLGHGIKIVIPNVDGVFEPCKHYSHFEIWKNDKIVFTENTSNEYSFLCDSSFTKARALSDNRFELLIEKFDAPDLNKILAIYLKGDKFESQQELPAYNGQAIDLDNDGKKEFSGILNAMEGYTNDSCYYNPTLYYEISDLGTKLDSVLTIKENTEIWGGFYGYVASETTILPCPKTK